MHIDALAKTIEKYRKAAGYDQQQLAKKLNVNRTTVINWENAVTKPSYDNMEAMIEELHISPSAFFFEEEEGVNIFVTGRAYKKIGVVNAVIDAINDSSD